MNKKYSKLSKKFSDLAKLSELVKLIETMPPKPASYWAEEDKMIEEMHAKNHIDTTMTYETFHRKFDL